MRTSSKAKKNSYNANKMRKYREGHTSFPGPIRFSRHSFPGFRGIKPATIMANIMPADKNTEFQ